MLGLDGYKSRVNSDQAQPKQRQAVGDATTGRASLHRQFSDQLCAFAGLTAETRLETIGAVRTSVNRIAAWRHCNDITRARARLADIAAAVLLSGCHLLDAEGEKLLRGLITDAASIADMPEPVETDRARPQATAQAHYSWLRDGRDTARVLVARRYCAIRLGVGGVALRLWRAKW